MKQQSNCSGLCAIYPLSLDCDEYCVQAGMEKKIVAALGPLPHMASAEAQQAWLDAANAIEARIQDGEQFENDHQ